MDFTEELRHRCRNTQAKLSCGAQLKTPTPNKREAFCGPICFSTFYRKRCLVCEKPMERKSESKVICGSRKCRNAMRSGLNLGRFYEAPNSKQNATPPPKRHEDAIGAKVTPQNPSKRARF